MTEQGLDSSLRYPVVLAGSEMTRTGRTRSPSAASLHHKSLPSAFYILQCSCSSPEKQTHVHCKWFLYNYKAIWVAEPYSNWGCLDVPSAKIKKGLMDILRAVAFKHEYFRNFLRTSFKNFYKNNIVLGLKIVYGKGSFCKNVIGWKTSYIWWTRYLKQDEFYKHFNSPEIWTISGWLNTGGEYMRLERKHRSWQYALHIGTDLLILLPIADFSQIFIGEYF